MIGRRRPDPVSRTPNGWPAVSAFQRILAHGGRRRAVGRRRPRWRCSSTLDCPPRFTRCFGGDRSKRAQILPPPQMALPLPMCIGGVQSGPSGGKAAGRNVMTQALKAALIVAAIVVPASSADAADKWITSWIASAQGPYPVGNASAQPVLKFAFPTPETGAHDQTFRLVLMPDLWGHQARLRFSNVFGTKPVTLDGVYAGLQLSSAALVAGSNHPVTFGGNSSVTIEPGKDIWSDAVALPFVKDAKDLAGRKLAVSFHIGGDSGPMTWHAKGLQTSYVTAPGAGAKEQTDDETAFPYSTASWYFLDAVDM